ncbi:MAG: MarR family winged helix-turn-helix transcriptional regulator [Litoreibacter sp.]|nr:MarR family winged helix-turn-helix transcriptional regulator [Litoreibacter sp.]
MSEDLSLFLPYLLHRAAEQTGAAFERRYRDRYGMLRTEWRVLFHVGQMPGLTAKLICAKAGLHKTKVSRAIRALEKKRFLKRETVEEDRRSETLHLTRAGQAALKDLGQEAIAFDAAFEAQLGTEELATLKKTLLRLVEEG